MTVIFSKALRGRARPLSPANSARPWTDSGSILVCYNRLLSERLRQQTAAARITAGTWHGVVRDFILKSSVSEERE